MIFFRRAWLIAATVRCSKNRYPALVCADRSYQFRQFFSEAACGFAQITGFGWVIGPAGATGLRRELIFALVNRTAPENIVSPFGLLQTNSFAEHFPDQTRLSYSCLLH
jgi:hypothetical protein